MFLSALWVLVPIFGMTFLFFVPVNRIWGWGGDMWGMPGLSGLALFGVGIVALFLLVYLVFCLAGGIGILQGKEWGRVLSIVHAALSLLWFPIGTVIGVLILVYLTKPEVKEYFQTGGDRPASP